MYSLWGIEGIGQQKRKISAGNINDNFFFPLQVDSCSESDLSSDVSDWEQDILQTVLDQCIDDDDDDDDDDNLELDHDRDSREVDNGLRSDDGENELGSVEEVSHENELGEEVLDEVEQQEKVVESGRDEGAEEAPLSLFAANNDVEKGKAAREQISEC